MPYSTQEEVQIAAGGPERLVELADHDDDGAVDVEVVEKAIAAADSLIDSYLQRRHKVPLASPPDAVKRMSAEIAVFLMKRDRRALGEDDRDDQETRLTWLRDVAKGLASPGVDPPPEKSSSVGPKLIDRAATEDISRESLKGFW